MNVTTLGIDLAKDVFQLHCVDKHGYTVLRKKLGRKQLSAFLAQLPPCLVGMEACAGSHYRARAFGKMGHTVKLMHARYVKPYVKTHKNDARTPKRSAKRWDGPVCGSCRSRRWSSRNSPLFSPSGRV